MSDSEITFNDNELTLYTFFTTTSFFNPTILEFKQLVNHLNEFFNAMDGDKDKIPLSDFMGYLAKRKEFKTVGMLYQLGPADARFVVGITVFTVIFNNGMPVAIPDKKNCEAPMSSSRIH